MEERKTDSPKLQVRDFSLSFHTGKGWYPAVEHVNLEIYAGEMVALIGESGCGKSVTALSVMGLEPDSARLEGSICFQGQELVGLPARQWPGLRGNRISMIFQEPMTALNPLIPVGRQIAEAVLAHQRTGRKAAKQLALAVMEQVGLPDVEQLYGSYPHQLSGGQRQRVMIAMAFVNNPQLLIADEPTTALDVTIQAQIMALMRKMNRERGSAVLLISHDLGVVQSLCSRAYIMYAGRIVESGEVSELLTHPLHPYTRGLAASVPSAAQRGRELASIMGTVPPLEERKRQGCGFCGRCVWRQEICDQKTPSGQSLRGRQVWCHRAEEIENYE